MFKWLSNVNWSDFWRELIIAVVGLVTVIILIYQGFTIFTNIFPSQEVKKARELQVKKELEEMVTRMEQSPYYNPRTPCQKACKAGSDECESGCFSDSNCEDNCSSGFWACEEECR